MKSTVRHTEHSLTEMLRQRHSGGDAFVAGAKMGPAGSQTLDGWALLATWSPWTTVGYEIKCSRSDWLRDQKFAAYLPTCHLFYVVAPKGVVEKTELPDGVGLLEPVGDGAGARLLTRAKAARREPDLLSVCRLMSYILMWRRGEFVEKRSSRLGAASSFKEWLDTNGPFTMIGSMVSERMRAEIRGSAQRASDAETKLKSLQEWVGVLRELEIDPTSFSWDKRRDVKRALARHGDETLGNIDHAIRSLHVLRAKVQDAVSPDSTEEIA